MVGRQEQARLHGDRYFGGVTSATLTRPAGAFVSRTFHPEEARAYYITVDGSASGFARMVPPADARPLTLGGPHATIWNSASSAGDLYVVDSASSTLAQLPPGNSVQIYLTDNSTAAGTWIACAFASSAGVVSGPRTFVS